MFPPADEVTRGHPGPNLFLIGGDEPFRSCRTVFVDEEKARIMNDLKQTPHVNCTADGARGKKLEQICITKGGKNASEPLSRNALVIYLLGGTDTPKFNEKHACAFNAAITQSHF